MKKTCFAAALAVLTMLCVSCAAPARQQSYAMSTYLSQELYGIDAQKAAEENEDIVLLIENELSATLPASKVYILNENGSGKTDGHLADILDEALYYESFTAGTFSPYMREIVILWDIGGENQRVPSEKETYAAAEKLRESAVVFDGGYIDLAGKKLDFGGIAKGYALDKMYENSVAAGIDSGIIDFGGSVAAIGKKSDGKKWTVGIKDPFGEKELAASVKLSDAFISTSGVYERFFISDGIRYHHIFDPKTGRSADTGLMSVSVMAEKGVETDALSTALFVMGKDEGFTFAEQNGIAAVFVCDSGEVKVTEAAGRDYAVELY